MPSFTMGIEEEYLLVDRDTLSLSQVPSGLLDECQAAFPDQVSPEYLRCQIEVGSRICETIGEARDDLRRLRAGIAERAANYNLSPIAASCHPFADWKTQEHTDKERYNALRRDLGGVARRMLTCGMHVHVGVEDKGLRVDLMPQLSYFLPHLLALSTSSPFWQGVDTGLASYRLTVFDNLPRTGLPPVFDSWADFHRATGVLIDLGVIEDTSKIWWDLRPSHSFPTLESRICDMSPRLEDALSLAAATQAIARFLWRLRVGNLRWRVYDRFLIAENRWRAQRYGIEEGLIDFGQGAIRPFADLLDELVTLVAEDAEALGCTEEVEALRTIPERGTSATRQRRAHEAAGENEAGGAVVRHLIDEFHADL